jgi:serine protease Do
MTSLTNEICRSVNRSVAFAFMLGSVLLSPLVHADETEIIERVTQASVMIRAQLFHGLAEDDRASGRWKGSGFVIDRERGWIMTNAHVAGSGPVKLRVQFSDSDEKFEAERVFVDTRHDIAVLAVDPEDIPKNAEALSLDCDFELRRGLRVVAVGHPQLNEFSVTIGVLSGLKSFAADPDLLSTDVVVEPGSSGGPVVSLESGKVVGITTSAYEGSDIGFLTKSRDACPIAELLSQDLDPSRPKLGFQLLIKDSKWSAEVGQIMNDQIPLKVGDLVVAIAGLPWNPETDGEFEDRLRQFQGNWIDLLIEREGEMIPVLIPNEKLGSLHERDWIHFSGLTFAVSKHQDSAYRNGATELPVIRLQSMDDGYDDTVELSFDDYGLLRSIDGREFLSLREMYDYLVEKENERVSVVVRSWDMTHEWVAFPFQHFIRVEDLKSSFQNER